MVRPFAVPSELSAFMQTDVPEATAKLNLAVVSGAVRSYCGWAVSAGRVEGQRVRCHPRARSIWLPTLHLRAVETLTPLGALGLVEGRQYLWSEEGRIELLFGWQTSGTYVVTYQHGYLDDHPAIDSVRGVVLSAAARLVDNPRSYRSETETTGGETTSWTSAGAGPDVVAVLAAGEMKQLDPYRLPVLG